MLLLRSAGLNIYAIPKVKNIDILFSQNRSCAGARTLYIDRFTFFCMFYVLCFPPYHSSIFPGHACFSVPCCLGLPLPVILLHSRKAFPAFPYGLSRVLKWAFPHGGKAFSVFLKKLFDAFFRQDVGIQTVISCVKKSRIRGRKACRQFMRDSQRLCTA